MGDKLDRFGFGLGQVAGSCECGNEHPRSIKCGEFLTSWRPVTCTASWSATLLTSPAHQQKSQNGQLHTHSVVVKMFLNLFLFSSLQLFPTKEKRVAFLLFPDFRKKILESLQASPIFLLWNGVLTNEPLWNDTVTTEVIGKNLTQCHIVDYKYHSLSIAGPPRWKASDYEPWHDLQLSVHLTRTPTRGQQAACDPPYHCMRLPQWSCNYILWPASVVNNYFQVSCCEICWWLAKYVQEVFGSHHNKYMQLRRTLSLLN
jgi:hypothetical protein